MARRRYVLAYDITDDRRLRKVHSCAKTYGYSLQYSVFICDLDPMELTRLKWDLGALIAHGEDRIALIDLGGSRPPPGSFFSVCTPSSPSKAPRSSDRSTAAVTAPSPASARTQVRGKM
ncbi:MAG: CRISPR-associated endonuclease Cas2 [Acidimicrobiales bacterium]